MFINEVFIDLCLNVKVHLNGKYGLYFNIVLKTESD